VPVNTSQDMYLGTPSKDANKQSNIPYGFCKTEDKETSQSDALH